MSNTIKLFGFIAMSVMAFLAGSCDDPAPDSPTHPGLAGSVTITDNGEAITGPLSLNTQLTAIYHGDMQDVSYQWNRYGTAISGASGTTYTPEASGKYTVTASAQGYRSITSDTVTVLEPFAGSSAAEVVAGIKTGWNLGNTLDCSDLSWLGSNPSINALETAWGNPVTTQANITALKNAGFNAVRFPVSWTKCANSSYVIRADWMARVKQVVDYAVNNDMYIILNTHHDEEVFKFTLLESTKSLSAFQKIWEQIAEAFKDYDEKLIFEGLNEPRTKGSSAEWSGGTAEERTFLNLHYEVFVDTVRKSGGNNTRRILLLNTYAASGEAAAINGLQIPADIMENKIIAGYHAYAPYNFALNTNSAFNTWSKDNNNDTSPITTPIERAYSAFISKGIPVIIGEFGAMNKNNAEARAQWAEYYTNAAKKRGIPCFWWDNGATTGSGELFGLLNRGTNQFTYPEIVTALMKGSTGE